MNKRKIVKFLDMWDSMGVREKHFIREFLRTNRWGSPDLEDRETDASASSGGQLPS